jgi:hypothetical protein
MLFNQPVPNRPEHPPLKLSYHTSQNNRVLAPNFFQKIPKSPAPPNSFARRRMQLQKCTKSLAIQKKVVWLYNAAAAMAF